MYLYLSRLSVSRLQPTHHHHPPTPEVADEANLKSHGSG
jgi:hypothetical protein